MMARALLTLATLLVAGVMGHHNASLYASPSAAVPLPSVPSLSAPETWIISGQSNAVGCATGPEIATSSLVEMWAGGGWQPAREPLSFMDAHEGCQVGPWLPAALDLGRRIRLTGWGHAGSAIATWAADGAGWRQLETTIAASGIGARWFMWFQGETDAAEGNEKAYATKLEDLIARVRIAAENPVMRVLIVGLADAPFLEVAAGYARIREEQMAVAERDPLAIYVPAEGLPTAAPQQPHHLSAEGYRLLGARIAAVVR